MGILIGFATMAIGGIAIGVYGGATAMRTHQILLSLAGTIVAYFVLVGIPWALLLLEKETASLKSFFEAFFALSRSLLLLGLIPVLIAFGISAWMAR